MEDFEQRLVDLENGIEPVNRAGNHHSVLHNVGHGIRRTGANIGKMRDNLISAPFDIAQKVKKNVFGSADNIPVVKG